MINYFFKQMKAHLDLVVTLIIFVILSCIGLNVETTGDSGDSVSHFLFSKYAFIHPELLLDHWAKPFFVLVSAPFAQFGFKGIIIFNCLVASLTGLFTYKTAKNFGLSYAWLVFIFIFFCPLFFKLIFSGLTEFLFGFMLILSIYFITLEKYIEAATIASFLPFVRSEGLIILGVFGIFYLVKRKYILPLACLLIGHVVYSLAGWYYYKDILWVFTKIPYNNWGSPYGHGGLFDFVNSLNYVIEKPIYFTMLLGYLVLLISFFRKKSTRYSITLSILVYGGFTIFFIAHTIFWWLGIFNSMGLPRVLNAVIPLIALIALVGLNSLLDLIKSTTAKYIFISLIVTLVAAYPFTYRRQGVVFDKGLFAMPENVIIDEEVRPFVMAQAPDLHQRLVYTAHPYFGISLNIDHFDSLQNKDIYHLHQERAPAGAIVLWDDWFSVAESGFPLDKLKEQEGLTLLKEFKVEGGKKTKFAVFIANKK